MQFSAALLGQNILPNSLLSNSLNLGASPKKRQSFTHTHTHTHTHKTGRAIIELFFTALSGSYPARIRRPHRTNQGRARALFWTEQYQPTSVPAIP